MKRTGFLVALAAGALLAATNASAQTFGFGYGRGHFGRRSYSGFGLGVGGWGARRPVVKVQNAFTGDVAYAERTVNDFRADYEKRRNDPLGIKADVQRLDEAMERVRREAENYGDVTDRGADLLRTALDAEDRIDRRFRDANDPMNRRWDDIRRKIDRLARVYRVE